KAPGRLSCICGNRGCRIESSRSTSDFGALKVELPLITGSGYFSDFFKDQLANAHSLDEFDRQRTYVPNFQTQFGPVVVWVFFVVAKTGVNGRRGHVNAQPQPGHAAFSFDPRTQTGGVGQVDSLQRPTQNKMVRRQVVTRSGDINGLRVLFLQIRIAEARQPRSEPGFALAACLVAFRKDPPV